VILLNVEEVSTEMLRFLKQCYERNKLSYQSQGKDITRKAALTAQYGRMY